MSTELKASREKLEQAQNDLSAWKFTPDRYVHVVDEREQGFSELIQFYIHTCIT